MKITTATALRKRLFGALAQANRSQPTRIRSKRGDAVLMSYRQYQALRQQKKPSRKRQALQPLIPGKIRQALDTRADEAVMRYMGL